MHQKFRLLILVLCSLSLEARDLWINYVPVAKAGKSAALAGHYRNDDSRRSLDSLPEETTMRQKTKIGKPMNLHFGLALGSTAIADRATDPSESTISDQLSKNTYLGVQASYRLRSILGFDAEYFLGISPMHELAPNVSASIKQNGAMFDTYLWFPVPGLSKFLIFRAGLGAGLLDITTNTQELAGDTSFSVGTMGVYSVLGAELKFGKFMTTFADFSESFGEKAYQKDTNDPDVEKIEFPSGAKFNRIRLGTSFHITKHISIGAQYTKRMINLTNLVGSSIFDETQYMGIVQYRL